MRGMMTAWMPTMTAAISPSQKFCTMMKTSAVSAWPPSNAGWTKASPMKPPSGSTSSFTMRGDFRRLHALELAGRKAQDAVDELEADAPQHAFAEPALVGVDVEFEEAVDDDQQQEHQAERHQRLHARSSSKPVEQLRSCRARAGRN